MTRAERRRLGAGKIQTYTLTGEQLEKIKQDATSDAVGFAFIYMCALSINVVMDKMPQLWPLDVNGTNRAQRFTAYVMDLFDSIEHDYVTITEMVDAIAEETGVDLRELSERRRGVY